MRSYTGGPGQDYEEVLSSIGTFLDQRGMREVLIVETADGFIVQGLAPHLPDGGPTNHAGITIEKETLTFVEDDVASFIDEAAAQRRRGKRPAAAAADSFYENALCVLGRYLDQQSPRDIFLFEQDRSFVVRLRMGARTGDRHVLAEFTRDEVEQLIVGLGEPAEPASLPVAG
jgi:hypothetical protein